MVETRPYTTRISSDMGAEPREDFPSLPLNMTKVTTETPNQLVLKRQKLEIGSSLCDCDNIV